MFAGQLKSPRYRREHPWARKKVIKTSDINSICNYFIKKMGVYNITGVCTECPDMPWLHKRSQISLWSLICLKWSFTVGHHHLQWQRICTSWHNFIHKYWLNKLQVILYLKISILATSSRKCGFIYMWIRI